MSGSDDKDKKGPSLGGPTAPSGGPSLGGLTAPSSTGPSLGGPSLGGSDSIPDKLDDVDDSHMKDLLTKSPKKKTRKRVNSFEIIRRYKVAQRSVQKALQTLMSYEFKTKVGITSLNFLYRDLILNLFEGQLSYFQEQVDLIKKGEDDLSQTLMEEDLDNRASTQVFETLTEIINEEIDRFKEEKPLILQEIEEELTRHKDARLEPRACFWILLSTGLQLQKIKEKEKKAFEIVLSVMIQYKPPLKRTLGIFLYFCYFLVDQLSPFELDSARIKLKPGPTGTGYNMAPWIKYRYGTNSQSYMEYERFLNYFVRSFGKITGNAPKFDGGPKDGYQKWIGRTLSALEKELRTSEILVANARGDTLEGILIGLKDKLEEDFLEREFDDTGKLMNRPIGGEGAIKFLEWLFETGVQRFTTTNIASHGEVRLSLDIFKFIPDTIRWVNEYGERIIVDWLEEDEESNDEETSENNPEESS